MLFAHSPNDPQPPAALRQDPTGNKKHLLPVCIETCDVSDLLAQINDIDLVGSDKEQARDRLLQGIQPG